MTQVDFEKIKLIIWDLDDTFWKGIISEEEVQIPAENTVLLKRLADCGIVNSISSKNDKEVAEKILRDNNLLEYFVFNNINWEEKGHQIADKLEKMGLRAENTLFIDDNQRNLEEAKHYCPELMTAEPDIIPSLISYYENLSISDAEHKRLEQYRMLETKTEAEKKSSSKEEFLFESNIKITINKNCLEEIDRIAEMVQRTNQLNYTKHRDDKKFLEKLLTNDWNESGYIRVRDKFGDYGIVGFYCYNRREKYMEHFLFSCRVLGMGIEQYVYNKLGCPKFEIEKPVASELVENKEISWITEETELEITEDRGAKNRVRILLKGPCDMSAIEPYLAGGSITTEFNFINDKNFVTTGQNHSMHIYESATLSKEEIEKIVEDVPFIIPEDFETKLFTNEYHVICYSLLQDLAAGLYRNKKTGHYISFSSKNYDLTSDSYKYRFINKEIQGHNFDFTEEIIERFSEEWEFVGNTPFELLLRNLDYIYENVPGKPIFILLLGSEVECDKKSEEFADLVEIYREINPIMADFAADHDRMKIINPTEFIHSQDDFEDCINHFSRNVYYEIAGKICDYINQSMMARKKTDNGFKFDESRLIEEEKCGFKIDRARKQLWQVEINLLEQFKKCCKENGLTYYADFGTLIGAVRHQGFIPWDDDIDVTMPRPDYARFCEIAPSYFENPYFFQNYYTDKGNGRVSNFSRLRDERTTMIEEGMRDCKTYHQGIFIDIFPLDIAPPPSNGEGLPPIIQAITEIWFTVMDPKEFLTSIIGGYKPVIGLDSAVEILGMPYEERLKLFEDTMLGQYDKTDYIQVFAFISKYPSVNKACYSNSIEVPFENTTISIPNGYDEILRARYGDYMTPKQVPSLHNVEIVDPTRPYVEYYV